MNRKRFFTALLLLAFAFTGTAQAQPAAPALSEVPASPEDVFSVDISAMNPDDGLSLEEEQVQQLRSSDEEAKEEALQYVVFLAATFEDAAIPARTTMDLYEIYRFDSNEAHRIMALAGLHAIGSDNIMRQLSQDVQLERSAKVRRLTNAALIDYFGLEG